MTSKEYRENLAKQNMDLGALEALLDAAGIPERDRRFEDGCGLASVYVHMSVTRTYYIYVDENTPTEPLFRVSGPGFSRTMKFSDVVDLLRSTT